MLVVSLEPRRTPIPLSSSMGHPKKFSLWLPSSSSSNGVPWRRQIRGKVKHNRYATFCKAYGEAAALVNMRRVAGVAPFGLCFSSDTEGGLVPEIELVLQSEMVKWRIEGRQSMVKVGGERICLGVLDRGLEQGSPIVLGGLQLEHYLLEFDLETSMLGFSSSLLLKGTTCSSSLQDSKLKQFM